MGKGKGNGQLLKFFEDEESFEKIKAGIEKELNAVGGGVNKQLAPRGEELSYLAGKTVADMALTWKIDEVAAVVRLLKLQPNMGVLTFGMSEADMLNFLKQKYIVLGSDGLESHPRGAGSFTKAISEYAIAKKFLPLKEMIYKATGLTAKIFKLKDRGVIKEGAYADIVIFDPITYKVNATYQDPAALATGVMAVFVNGKLAIEHDTFKEVLAGVPIRYNIQ